MLFTEWSLPFGDPLAVLRWGWWPLSFFMASHGEHRAAGPRQASVCTPSVNIGEAGQAGAGGGPRERNPTPGGKAGPEPVRSPCGFGLRGTPALCQLGTRAQGVSAC